MDTLDNNENNKLDLSYLKEVASGSAEFMIEMIEMFILQTPVYMKELEAAIIAHNWDEVASVAHKIKPTLTFVGYDDGRKAMADIEHKARTREDVASLEKDFSSINTICGTLFSKLAAAKIELEKEL